MADEWLKQHPALAADLAEAGGWTTEEWSSATVFLVALHDIGKFSRAFQAMVPELWPPALGDITTVSAGRHDAIGMWILANESRVLDVLEQVFFGWRDDDVRLLIGAVAGHHGRPIEESPSGWPRSALDEASLATASEFVAACSKLIMPEPLSRPPKGWAAKASWWLAGLTNLADWIGSAQHWFEYEGGSDLSLDAYWRLARTRAQRAIAESGLLPCAPGEANGLAVLMQNPAWQATPVQALAEVMALPDGAVTVVIEDATGSGKTEAALLIAQRLIAEGRADGLFVALPTMATADAMFERLAQSYRRLFGASACPSLALAHGRADLNDLFQGSILPSLSSAGDAGDAAGETASTQCAAWLAEERRRAFLAHVGVGTIDQALLGVLPAKYAALRLLGLARKVLVIDEAHSFDPYVSAELDALLRFHAMQGGHSVVLSATLPQSRRAGLLAAVMGEECAPVATAYPLVTVAGGETFTEHPSALRPELRRSVPVRRMDTVESAATYLATSARAGACGIWIRNTVDDVRAGAEALRALGVEPIVFHARFAMGDRLAIQADVLRLFGKHATAEDRAPGGIGRVLVASQVAEQSLDLDGDVMVSDLAPIDLLLQRAGRLRRHPERARPDEVPAFEFLVLSPEPAPQPGANWAANPAIGGSRFVYAPHVLWRSARAMFGIGHIAVPEGVRSLVEAVYGAAAEPVPNALTTAENKEEGLRIAQESTAASNLLKPERGYCRQNGDWAPDIVMPTRLGDDYRIFRLAREVDGEIKPWCEDAESARAWAFSEISLRRSLATDAVVPPQLEKALDRLRAVWPVWQREIPVLVLTQAAVNDDRMLWSASILGRDGNCEITYSVMAGLARFSNSEMTRTG